MHLLQTSRIEINSTNSEDRSMETHTRRAQATDAAEAADVLRRSIIELCVSDHQNDPTRIDEWISNKTEEAWRKWVRRDDAVVLVAQRNCQIVGVGMVSLGGEILLNYVHPEARFTGVSKAMLTAVETELRSHKIQRCWLESTVTAASFYMSCGFSAEPRGTLFFAKAL